MRRIWLRYGDSLESRARKQESRLMKFLNFVSLSFLEKMKYRVVIPDEKYSVIEFEQEACPGVAFVNIGLRGFEPKVVFAWHLSIMIDFEGLIENGMPSKKERAVIDEFEDRLDPLLKGEDFEKPNAIFLARITWNKTRELIWRIYDAEVANGILQSIIDQNQCPRQFDYRIDHDVEWKLAEWSLKNYS